MSMPQIEKCRRRMIRRCRKIIAECDQCLRDIAWWNTNRSECPPIDPEPFRVKGMLARQVLECVEQRRPIPDDIARRFTTDD